MPEIVTMLGRRVAELRREAEMTQKELAVQTGYSVDFIGMIERGINAPTLERLQDIANALGVEAWQLLCPPRHQQSKPPRKRRPKAE